MRRIVLTPALGLMLAFALAATPADAQGNGKSKKQGKASRPPVTQTDDRIYDDRDPYGDHSQYGRIGNRGNGAGKVPEGWCRGVGNPHNTPENCGFASTGRYDDRRIDDRRSGYPTASSGSYEMEHEEFHRYLDRKYSDLAARRRTDIQYQLQLRLEKRSEHDRWHERVGVRH